MSNSHDNRPIGHIRSIGPAKPYVPTAEERERAERFDKQYSEFMQARKAEAQRLEQERAAKRARWERERAERERVLQQVRKVLERD